jgi:hypothetical protein
VEASGLGHTTPEVTTRVSVTARAKKDSVQRKPVQTHPICPVCTVKQTETKEPALAEEKCGERMTLTKTFNMLTKESMTLIKGEEKKKKEQRSTTYSM